MEQKREAEQQPAFSVRTDLAIEAREMAAESQPKQGNELDGVEVETREEEDYSLTHVRILSEAGSQLMGKPIGNYITIESEKLKENDIECHEEMIRILAENIRALAKLEEGDSVLVAGLGNWNITPDALGPKVVSRILVTRHLQGTLPEEIEETVRPVAAISPGVMGITGIETGEIIRGIVDKLHPSLLIAIDALAARRSNRINAAIQMSDTGVAPGAGVGNCRMMLDEENLDSCHCHWRAYGGRRGNAGERYYGQDTRGNDRADAGGFGILPYAAQPGAGRKISDDCRYFRAVYGKYVCYA